MERLVSLAGRARFRGRGTIHRYRRGMRPPAVVYAGSGMAPLMDEIRRVAAEILGRGKFLVTLGGEHSITPPLVAAAAGQFKDLSVLQIDAHADLRDCYMGTPHNHACAMRRSLDYARVTQVGIRSISTEEAEA